MATTLEMLVFFILITFFGHVSSSSSAGICQTSYCGSNAQDFRFPFRLIINNNSSSQAAPAADHDHRCSYPGFDLSCNNHMNNINGSNMQALLSLPNSGEFIVKKIDYRSQTININDDVNNMINCMPKRYLLRNFNLSGTPFEAVYRSDITFLNCSSSSNSTTTTVEYPAYGSENKIIGCLSTSNYTVMAVPTSRYAPAATPTCRVMISKGLVPMTWYYTDFDVDDVVLKWVKPSCGDCEWSGGSCGSKNDTGSHLGCFYGRNYYNYQPLSRRIEHGITGLFHSYLVALMVPSIILMLILFAIYYTCCRDHLFPDEHLLVGFVKFCCFFVLLLCLCQSSQYGHGHGHNHVIPVVVRV